jgi:putative transposase
VLALDGETFARTSNGMVFEDYHVTNTKYLTLEKRFNTWNAQLENKYKTNGYKKTENIKRLEKEINLLARKMKNIRKNWANETIHKIVSTRPGEIIVVMRDHDSQIIDKKWGNVMTFYLMLQRKCASNNIRITMTYDKESQKRENSEVLRETA